MNITPKKLQKLISENSLINIIDLRNDNQKKNNPLKNLKKRDMSFEKIKISDLNENTILICQFGIETEKFIIEKKLSNVYNLIGGAAAWNYYISKREDISRYARQLVLPQVGEKGQKQILDSKISIIGLGGLGTAVAQYLVAAGIGTIKLIDGDIISLTNLHRQPIYPISSIGDSKSEILKKILLELNENCTLISYNKYIDDVNISEILKDTDIIVDATDNINSRLVIDRFCKKSKIPLVYGALYKFEGQVAVFNHNSGISYSDIFSNNKINENCNDVGILGMLPSIIGNIQSLEVLKIILNISPNLSEKLLIYDGLSHTMEKIELI